MHLVPQRGSVATAQKEILGLVRTRRAVSRADLARLAGLSPTTVAARVGELIEQGRLRESGLGTSGGGRRPRRLEVAGSTGVIAVVTLGEVHATVTLFDAACDEISERFVAVDVREGAEQVLGRLAELTLRELDALGEQHGPLLVACVGVPGPVDRRTGRVSAPARMPGWHGVDVAALVRPVLGVPVLVENDANLMAVGEHEARGGVDGDLVVLKAGSGIGCGIVTRGRLHTGAGGFAGEISHAGVPDAPPVPCSCGRIGCLDAVASGASLLARLREQDEDVATTDDLLAFARDGHPLATSLLREAGERTGAVVSTIVNFFNPDALVVAGSLSQADAFVAGLRSAVHAQCLPMVTDTLELAVSKAGPRAGARGGARLAADAAIV